jgi:hypothetical protein
LQFVTLPVQILQTVTQYLQLHLPLNRSPPPPPLGKFAGKQKQVTVCR